VLPKVHIPNIQYIVLNIKIELDLFELNLNVTDLNVTEAHINIKYRYSTRDLISDVISYSA